MHSLLNILPWNEHERNTPGLTTLVCMYFGGLMRCVGNPMWMGLRVSKCCHISNDLFCWQVVPLSQRSGVLEWCSGTVPIGEYLVNSDDGAHKRYRPADYSSLQCQKKLMVCVLLRALSMLYDFKWMWVGHKYFRFTQPPKMHPWL